VKWKFYTLRTSHKLPILKTNPIATINQSEIAISTTEFKLKPEEPTTNTDKRDTNKVQNKHKQGHISPFSPLSLSNQANASISNGTINLHFAVGFSEPLIRIVWIALLAASSLRSLSLSSYSCRFDFRCPTRKGSRIRFVSFHLLVIRLIRDSNSFWT